MKSRAGFQATQERSQIEVPWRVVAFDLDDTLFPESEFVRSGFREVALWSEKTLHFNPESTFRELMTLFEGGTRGTVFDSWVAAHDLSKDTIQEMVRVYREHYPEIHVFPGVGEMISTLREVFRLGLLSDGYLGVQERKLSALGIAHHFEAVVLTDRLGREFWKPSVKPFVDLMGALNASPEETVYVGDNPTKDFIACRQLGMHSIWLRQSNGIYAGLAPEPDGCAEYVVESIAGLMSLLLTGR